MKNVIIVSMGFFMMFNPTNTNAEEMATRRRRVVSVPKQANIYENQIAPNSQLNKKIVSSNKEFQSEVPQEIKDKWNETIISLNFKTTHINDVVQSLNSLYGVNVAVAQGIQNEITLHLENIGLVDALEVLCKTNELSLGYSGGVFYINPISEATRNLMKSIQGRIDLDIQNQDIKSFIREFSQQTGLKILASKNLTGTVTGSWKSVKPLEGFKALMAAHHYRVKMKNDFYIVEEQDEDEANPQRANRRTMTGRTEISVSNNKVSLNLQNANLQDVLVQLSEEADLNTIFYGEFREVINARLENVSYDEAFSSLLRGTPYTYLLNDNGTLLVGAKDPKTESGKILSTYELYRLNHVKAEDVFKVLPASVNKSLLTVIKEQNAVLISGTRVEIENIKSYLKSVDLEVPQVVLECTVVELTRSSGDEYGIRNINPETTAQFGAPSIQSYFTFSGGALYKYDRDNTLGEIGILPAGFKLEMSALETSNRAKVLAMPKITTLNGNKSSIRVTNTISLAEQAVGPNQTPILQYKEFTDGITLNITPFISNGGEITLEIKPEIKTSSVGASGTPTISERSLETTVKLNDSETIMLGGLIQSTKKKERQGVPILGSIPLLGYLFSYYKNVEKTTELVIFVTPHLLNKFKPSINLLNEVEAIENRPLIDSYKEQVETFRYINQVDDTKDDENKNEISTPQKKEVDQSIDSLKIKSKIIEQQDEMRDINTSEKNEDKEQEDKVKIIPQAGMIKHPAAQ